MLINDSNKFIKMIPKKEDIIKWISEMDTSKKSGSKPGIPGG